ncbi:MAG: type II toxin-antitoxin system VapC family toxin [Methylotenera sp.]|nr:type II toxin-antitoxin system VapC family toxin [Methylotenera sp.]
MILVDSSVWIDHLRASDTTLVQLLTQNNVLIHPFVRGELALGNLSQRSQILGLLDNLPQANIADNEEIIYFIEKHALFGQGIGLIDVHLLASSLLQKNTLLWTRDKRLMVAAMRLNIAATFDNEH